MYEKKLYTAKGVLHYKGGWIVLEAPHDVVNYYKWWVERFIGKKISTSYHKPHVTVLAGKHEAGVNTHPLWGKYEGKEVVFKYESKLYTDHDWFFLGKYFWLRVHCPFLQQVRTELGLRPNLKWPLHLTIGYCGY